MGVESNDLPTRAGGIAPRFVRSLSTVAFVVEIMAKAVVCEGLFQSRRLVDAVARQFGSGGGGRPPAAGRGRLPRADGPAKRPADLFEAL